MSAPLSDDVRTVTVCAACLRASCWQDQFPCDRAVGARTTERTVAALRDLDLESAHYWKEGRQ